MLPMSDAVITCTPLPIAVARAALTGAAPEVDRDHHQGKEDEDRDPDHDEPDPAFSLPSLTFHVRPSFDSELHGDATVGPGCAAASPRPGLPWCGCPRR